MIAFSLLPGGAPTLHARSPPVVTTITPSNDPLLHRRGRHVCNVPSRKSLGSTLFPGSSALTHPSKGVYRCCTESAHTHESQRATRIAVLVSGSGRSLQNICERIQAGTLKRCAVELVIVSKRTAGAIEKAERFGIATHVMRLKDFEGDTEKFSQAISLLLDEHAVDLVVLAGWMHFFLIPPRYEGKVLNIHPSLIPAFCGKGYYGHRVHEAVLEFGAKVTGCTVHFADNKYDHGPIILQQPVAVEDTDTADDIAQRVFEREKEALPEAIQLFVDNKLYVDGRRIKILRQTPALDG